MKNKLMKNSKTNSSKRPLAVGSSDLVRRLVNWLRNQMGLRGILAALRYRRRPRYERVQMDALGTHHVCFVERWQDLGRLGSVRLADVLRDSLPLEVYWPPEYEHLGSLPKRTHAPTHSEPLDAMGPGSLVGPRIENIVPYAKTPNDKAEPQPKKYENPQP